MSPVSSLPNSGKPASRRSVSRAPRPQGTAPAPVSALLSALVVKASFYLLLRLWVFVFDGLPLAQAAAVLAVLGGVAVVYG